MLSEAERTEFEARCNALEEQLRRSATVCPEDGCMLWKEHDGEHASKDDVEAALAAAEYDNEGQPTAADTDLCEVAAELNKHGAPPDARPQARIRALVAAHQREIEATGVALRTRIAHLESDHRAELAAGAALRARKLPPERKSFTRKIEIGGTDDLYVTVGLFEDGTPGEIFLKMNKQGTTLSGLMDAFAIACSLLLKHGVPLEKLSRKFQNLRFEPSGATGSPDMPFVSSPVDAAFKWLERRFAPPAPEAAKEGGE